MQGRLENEIKAFKQADEVIKDLPDFVNEWYITLKNSDKTALSCYDFVRKVRRFLEYINSNPQEIDTEDITLEACESFIISYQTKKDKDGMEVYISNNYQNAMWYALNSFLKFLEQKKYIDHNYLNDIQKPKCNKTVQTNTNKTFLTQNDFKKIITVTKQGSQYKQGLLNNRDILIILLFMTTGITKSAMSEIDIEDIDWTNYTLTVQNRKKTIQVYELNEQVIAYLNQYLDDRKQLETPLSNGALFLKQDGTRLGDDAIYNIVNTNCYKALGKKISPQQLRASFCSIIYKKTRDVKLVQKAVGISKIHNVKKYIQTDNKEQKTAMKIMTDILNQ